MPVKQYSFKDIAGYAGQFVLLAGVAVAGAAVMPVWALVAGAVIGGGLTVLAVKATGKIMEEGLKAHPRESAAAPRLGAIVDEIYKKAGLNLRNNPVYNYEMTEEAKTGEVAATQERYLSHLRKNFAASATNVNRPTIAISERLLGVLDDAEQKAVLSHEASHAAARHHNMNVATLMVSSILQVAGSLGRIAAVLSTGFLNVVTAILATGIGAGVAKLSYGGKALKVLSKENATAAEKARKKEISAHISAFSRGAGVAVISFVKPGYLLFFAGTLAVSTASSLIHRAVSRRMEYQADRGAVKLGADPLALVTSLRKLVLLNVDSQTAIQPRGVLARAWKKACATHPPTEKRLARLAKMARKSGADETAIAKAMTGALELSPRTMG